MTKVLYPASHDIPSLSDELLAVKIARYSSCSVCSSCRGLRPPPSVEVVLDSQQDALEDITGGPSEYLQECSCGHSTVEHGADAAAIGAGEFARRGRVAVRLDEFLEDVDKLLDFDYTDEDVEGLRPQMQLRASPASSISDALGSLGKYNG
ncbi:hypothetical protein IEO21_01479 [Rhodonia placenta]|uniref:Uncharacterized protein n=2 Tax=Rhodonia placenta TaxID=104341 RepID=A0A1X6NCC1_9APHY|nr:hypothetical protein POSPLADRAFT_1133401 [Postia placenta MAD-698-R-SB12]KAF9820265.1 hypothetical protein IEO21_01479 [Postia placenta]OSX66297.1 hypothetical protein POSPLADRAFT_1133401 [Postia placenta MAD-698-R-SB12]